MKTTSLLPFILVVASTLSASEQFPIGILGGRGEVKAGSPLLTILSTDPDSPAIVAGLKAGDQIQGINGTPFTAHSNKIDDGGNGPQKALGEALDHLASQTDEQQRKIALDLIRDEKSISLEISLPFRPGLESEEGRQLLVADACKQLLKTRTPTGYWNSPVGLTGDRVLSAWALVALLSSDIAENQEAIDQAAAWLRGPDGNSWIPDDPMKKGPDNLGNWAISATAVALSEHRIATDDERDDPVIERCCNALKSRMSKEGLFGHDIVPGYSNKGFNVINTLSQLAWAMGSQAGMTLDEETWSKSLEQIRRSIDPNGGVRYWTMKGTGTGDASLRTSSMALALSIADQEAEMATKLGHYLATHPQRTREAHAVGSLGMMLAPSALWRLDREGYWNFAQEWRWYLSLMHRPDGSLHYIGGKRNNGGDGYLGKHRIGCIIAVLILTPPGEKLRLHATNVTQVARIKPGKATEATSPPN
ncbi:MAG: DUF6288 domain-containing protein [Planctomycetota bacterium]|nr:hypothetical protein [Planctomycetota bacterium]MEE2883261.1 DUF6288 domain-containing protein [Planctomycetota bacterium]